MNVLLLGDSHTHGSYGQQLEQLLKGAQHTVTRVGRVGATASSYLTGNWSKLVGSGNFDAAKAGAYDLLILSLGTNDAAGMTAQSAKAADDAAAKIKQLSDSIKAQRVVYVGPPAFSANAAKTYNPKAFSQEDLNSRAARLWAAVKGKFSTSLDPREATKAFTQPAEIHFGAKGGEAWAQYVYQQVSTGLNKSVAAAQGFPVGAVVAVVAVSALLAVAWARRSA